MEAWNIAIVENSVAAQDSCHHQYMNMTSLISPSRLSELLFYSDRKFRGGEGPEFSLQPPFYREVQPRIIKNRGTL